MKVSASKIHKNALLFNRMIGLAKQNQSHFECILLWKYSRFAHNREDSIVYKSMLRKATRYRCYIYI